MSTHLSQITVGIGPLTIKEVVAVARYGATVDIDPDALAAVENTRPCGCISCLSSRRLSRSVCRS